MNWKDKFPEENRYYEKSSGILYLGNTIDILKTFPDESVDCIITSPPYWGLRDYGEQTNTIWGGNPNCEHEWEFEKKKQISQDYTKLHIWDKDGRKRKAGEKTIKMETVTKSGFCKKCGAWYGQLGLEPTLDLYLDHLIEVMKELKRILKPTGIIFWNHGDSYGGGGNPNDRKLAKGLEIPKIKDVSVKPKCLSLQNYRFILRCIDEIGLILRDTIIWSKKVWIAKENRNIGNAMPSSVRDRCTFTYEPVFMLVKNKKYFFDQDELRVPFSKATYQRIKYAFNSYKGDIQGAVKHMGQQKFAEHLKEGKIKGANRPNVWQINTEPVKFTHFACFPTELVRWFILSGCPERVCKKCGKARVRITKTNYYVDNPHPKGNEMKASMNKNTNFKSMRFAHGYSGHFTIGWTDCGCNAGWDSGIVLDPFMGAGTTAIVAEKLKRNWIGIDLNESYHKIAIKRLGT